MFWSKSIYRTLAAEVVGITEIQSIVCRALRIKENIPLIESHHSSSTPRSQFFSLEDESVSFDYLVSVVM